MSNGDTTEREPTRRDYVKYGGAVIGGGLLAGCTGAGNSESTPTASGTPIGTGKPTDTQPDSWEVTMEPTGTITFEEVPDSFTVYHNGWADVMASLGQFDKLIGMSSPDDFAAEYYDRLPGVSLDTSRLSSLYPQGASSGDKEIFYELGPDINLIDPNVAADYLGLDDADIEEISENVAPFFGSWMRRPQFTDEHPYYTLYEGLGKAATIFREEARYQALMEVHESMLENLAANLPAEREDLRFAYMNHNVWENGTEFYLRNPILPGYEHKVYRDLGLDSATNVFQGQVDDGSSADVSAEAVLEADPDLIIYQSGIKLLEGGMIGDTEYHFEEDVVGAFKDDPVMSEVSAVKNDRVFPGPRIEQGPVTNFFSTEMLAKALYPEQFGEFDMNNQFETPEEDRVFDRQRVADIINGEF